MQKLGNSILKEGLHSETRVEIDRKIVWKIAHTNQSHITDISVNYTTLTTVHVQ